MISQFNSEKLIQVVISNQFSFKYMPKAKKFFFKGFWFLNIYTKKSHTSKKTLCLKCQLYNFYRV